MDRHLRELERRYRSGSMPIGDYLRQLLRAGVKIDPVIYETLVEGRTFNIAADYVDLSEFTGLITIAFYGAVGSEDEEIHTLGPWLDDDAEHPTRPGYWSLDHIAVALRSVFTDLEIDFPIEIDEDYADADDLAVGLRVPPNTELIENIVKTLRRELDFPHRIGGEIKLKDGDDDIFSGTAMGHEEYPFIFPVPEVLSLKGGCPYVSEILSSPVAVELPLTFAGDNARNLANDFSDRLSRDLEYPVTISHLGFLADSLQKGSPYWVVVGHHLDDHKLLSGDRVNIGALLQITPQRKGGWRSQIRIIWDKNYDPDRFPLRHRRDPALAEQKLLRDVIKDANVSEEVCWLPEWVWS